MEPVKQRIVLLGPPAAGKGTQAEMIKTRYCMEAVSPGALLRQETERGTPLGLEADRLTRGGNFVPDAMVVSLLDGWLGQFNGSFVLDGFPRNLSQAHSLENILGKRGLALSRVLFLNVPFEALQKRVSDRFVCIDCSKSFSLTLHPGSARGACLDCNGTLGRRQDDTPEALEVRLRHYEAQTFPLINHYREQGLLHEVRGTANPDSVFQEIASFLEAA